MRAAKCDLRKRLVRTRDARDPLARARTDARIAETLFSDEIWRCAQIVYSYVSIASEVSTRSIIARAWQSNKRVRVPRCERGTLRLSWHEIGSLAELEIGALGIPEPAVLERTGFDAPEDAGSCCGINASLAIVPGLAFDPHGNRLGYGGGCYDRFLASFDGVSVGLARETQLLASLAEMGVVETHDVPVEYVATERRILAARSARSDL
ncbi:5-formyltetrahydrofolate cyclo-ligase [Coriobacterium glomerans]|uniref:5-formyltetrahydrofolate cyclo-ligase n=1 Tax=Coriobacterium glomerans TaxID=33871 RepID=UPI00155A2795|nr:5-formyltetrahydrofolate cyclo-ligase [Coriobacterium glomerans]